MTRYLLSCLIAFAVSCSADLAEFAQAQTAAAGAPSAGQSDLVAASDDDASPTETNGKPNETATAPAYTKDGNKPGADKS
jgi:hypothetical protein